MILVSDGSCGPIDWNVLGIAGINEQPQIPDTVGRTGDFLYAYLVLSCVWIVSSMSLIGERLITNCRIGQFIH